jgi:hypothetical protein
MGIINITDSFYEVKMGPSAIRDTAAQMIEKIYYRPGAMSSRRAELVDPERSGRLYLLHWQQ